MLQETCFLTNYSILRGMLERQNKNVSALIGNHTAQLNLEMSVAAKMNVMSEPIVVSVLKLKSCM